MWPFKKKGNAVYPVVTPKEQAIDQIKKTLREFNFSERDEIIQSAIRDILPKKHLKYRPKQERYA
jgi:23S rRNA maturation-related 3'-5' exoribonuclease YhaM